MESREVQFCAVTLCWLKQYSEKRAQNSLMIASRVTFSITLAAAMLRHLVFSSGLDNGFNPRFTVRSYRPKRRCSQRHLTSCLADYISSVSLPIFCVSSNSCKTHG